VDVDLGLSAYANAKRSVYVQGFRHGGVTYSEKAYS